jgi:hypothetical protein
LPDGHEVFLLETFHLQKQFTDDVVVHWLLLLCRLLKRGILSLFREFFLLELLNFIHFFRLGIFVPRGKKVIPTIESEPRRLLWGFRPLIFIGMRYLREVHRRLLGGRACLLYFLSHVPSLALSLSHPHDFFDN